MGTNLVAIRLKKNNVKFCKNNFPKLSTFFHRLKEVNCAKREHVRVQKYIGGVNIVQGAKTIGGDPHGYYLIIFCYTCRDEGLLSGQRPFC